MKNFICVKCNKSYYYKELARQKIEGEVPCTYLICPECGEIIEEKEKKRKNTYGRKRYK